MARTFKTTKGGCDLYQISLSDLHLGEGRCLEDGAPNPLEDFEHDENFSKWLKIQHKKYVDGPICLNLLGDIFDPSQVRYEGRLIDPHHEKAALHKIRTIIKGHSLFFEALRDWVDSGHEISFFIGNHDAILAWPSIQALLTETVAKKNPALVSFHFEKTFEGTYFTHGNWDPFSRLNRDELFGEDAQLRIPVINMPDDSLFHIGVLNPLKLWNKHIGRMRDHRHAVIYRDALFRDWKLAWFAATSWLRVLLQTIRQFLTDKRFGRWKRLKRAANLLTTVLLNTFWNAIFGDDIERYAKNILKSRDLDAVVVGHTHNPIQKPIYGSWYVNTGTWSTSFVAKPRHGIRRLLFFLKPVIERQDRLTYVVTKHENGKTISVKLKEYRPNLKNGDEN